MLPFGAAIKYAIDLEIQGMNIYEYGARKSKNTKSEETLLDLAASNKKRKEMLEKLYGENIYSDQDTGIFEPIGGLETARYITQNQKLDQVDFSGILSLGMGIEEKSKSFYLDMAAQLEFRRRGIAKKLQKIAHENSERRLKLKSLQDSVSLQRDAETHTL